MNELLSATTDELKARVESLGRKLDAKSVSASEINELQQAERALVAQGWAYVSRVSFDPTPYFSMRVNSRNPRIGAR